MEIIDQRWRKSSFSGNGGGNCIEVGHQADRDGVAVRDTKDREGPVLTIAPAAWRRFIEQIKNLTPRHVSSPAPPTGCRVAAVCTHPLSGCVSVHGSG